MAFIALASAALFTSTGGSIKTIWNKTSTQLANAATADGNQLVPVECWARRGHAPNPDGRPLRAVRTRNE